MVLNMSTTLFLLFMLTSSLYSSVREATKTKSRTQRSSLYSCPYEKSCSTEVLRNVNIRDIECCQECSCDDQCLTDGICCPHHAVVFVDQDTAQLGQHENQTESVTLTLGDDVEMLNSTDKTTLDFYPCVSLHALLNKKRGVHAGNTIIEPFRIIDDCLSETLSQIYTECQSPTTLDNFRVVSDSRGYIYKNKECAKCHGVTNVTVWRTQPVCNSEILLQDLRSYEDLYDFVLHHCQLDTYVPSGVYISDLSRCFSNMTPSVQLCEVSWFHLNIKKNWPTPFTALLGGSSEATTKETDEPCKGDELFDEYTSTCRPFYCPITKMPSKGACMDMFTWYEGLRLEVLFRILNWNDSVVVDNFTHLTIDIQNEVLIGCVLCSYYFDIPGTGYENVFLRIRFSTTAWYNLDAVLEYFREIKDSVLEISTGTITFKLRVLFFSGDAYEGITLIRHEEKGCSGEILITEELSQNCRRIQVPITGYSPDIREQLAPDIKVDKGIADVCVEKYNEIMRSYALKDGQPSIFNECRLYLLYIALFLGYLN